MPQKKLTDYRRMVLLTDGFSDHFYAKTAISLLRYRREHIAGLLDRELAGKDASEVFQTGKGVPVVSTVDGLDADSLFIGIAPPGGRLPDAWRPIIADSLAKKIDIVSGLHQFLSDDPEFAEIAAKSGAQVIDVRKNDFRFVGTGTDFPSEQFRVLTVGQDCTVGKMVTSLEVQKELLRRDVDAGFAASGQTGIMISGKGLPIDCIVSDFLLGAAENLVKENKDRRVLLIEGQGSITHPAFSPVTLGLVHGTRPQAMILCYEARREEVKGFPGNSLHPLKDLMNYYLTSARMCCPCEMIGVAVNSRRLNSEEYFKEKELISNELRLPVCDVYREGAGVLADAVLQWEGKIK